jgi:hypothetical protein
MKLVIEVEFGPSPEGFGKPWPIDGARIAVTRPDGSPGLWEPHLVRLADRLAYDVLGPCLTRSPDRNPGSAPREYRPANLPEGWRPVEVVRG